MPGAESAASPPPAADMSASHERIGILGGTFDPVHVGHLMDASAARHQLALDRVLVVVARDPWQKRDRTLAPAEVRYEMVAAALDGVEGLEASRIELERDGPTYSIDTVEALDAPGRELFLIVGSEVAAGLPTWHRVDELRGRVTLSIVDRDPTPFPAPDGWRTARVAVPRLELSSTDLRDRVAAGAPIDFLVPVAAAHILRAHGLYQV
ncbi:MAG: nicotinate-nucleotide adenylyltransferase [Acidimicrobiia bacterium]